MAEITKYQRVDLTISIRRVGEKEVRARLLRPNVFRDERTLSARYFRDWLRHPESPVSDLPEQLGLTAVSQLWHEWPTEAASNQRRRLLLDLADHDLAGLPWEAALATGSLPMPVDVIARTSPVLPRNQSTPMTLPLRVLQVGSDQPLWSPDSMDWLFGPDDIHLVPQGIQVAHCSFDEVEEWRRESNWPWATILHFDLLPTLTDPASLFLVDQPERPGTLGWLTRLADSWQTRLVILYCYSAQQAIQARRLATAVVQQGGPAVIVGWQAESHMRTPFNWILNSFLHDEPLDDLAALSLMLPGPTGLPAAKKNPVSLFIGEGRADSLRYSPLMQTFVALADLFGASQRLDIPHWWPDMYGALDEPSFNRPQYWTGRRNAMRRMGESLGEMRLMWNNVDFSHETEAFKLASMTTGTIRNLGHMGMPVPWHVAAGHKDIFVVGGLPERPHVDKGRYVNSYLVQRQSGEVTQLPQIETTLLVGQTYHLCIQIGPRNPQFVTLGETALAEEVFKWQPDMSGVWLEVGVTGLDFEVLGTPLQSLWLPHPENEGAQIITEPIFFAIVPQTASVAQLRFTLYYKNDVIQSFRLAALTTEQVTMFFSESGRSLLATALGVPQSKVGDRRYLTRLEYSITNDLNRVTAQRPRALSIVANHHGNKTVITTKGTELFSVQTPGNLPKKVTDIRRKLDNISAPDGETYNFGSPKAPNEGDKYGLEQALSGLAEAGWDLYRSVSTPTGRQAVAHLLSGEGEIIHVAHVFLDKTIPWQLMYDRPFNPRRQKYGYEVCLAALPGLDGSIAGQGCYQNPQCVLHDDQCQRRAAEGKKPLREDTVVCPWHFWGFRHQIEAPAQQTDDERGRELYNCILAPKAMPRLLLGMNHTLEAEKHLKQLQNIVANAGLATSWPTIPLSNIDDILEALEFSELDLIYFLCHARGGEIEDSEEDPYLEFDPPDGKILAADLPDVIWNHHPLVFLNGCHTVGFSPRSLSPFVHFMSQQQVGGVIGTEISVFDRLAKEVAERFMKAFFDGAGAGEALLLARRQLLAQYNPLGLAYTLFAAADLRLDLSGDGCNS